MSFKVFEKAFERSQGVFYNQIITEIERLARMVIQTEEKAKAFTMAMGTAFFCCEWVTIEDGEEWEHDETLEPCELADGNCYAQDLADLFEKWGEMFRLTGHPMRITIDHVTGELVTVSDW